MLSAKIIVARHSCSGRTHSHSGDVANIARQIAAGIGISNRKKVFQALHILKDTGIKAVFIISLPLVAIVNAPYEAGQALLGVSRGLLP